MYSGGRRRQKRGETVDMGLMYLYPFHVTFLYPVSHLEGASPYEVSSRPSDGWPRFTSTKPSSLEAMEQGADKVVPQMQDRGEKHQLHIK